MNKCVKSDKSASLNGKARESISIHEKRLEMISSGMQSDIEDRCLYEEYGSLKELILDSLNATVEKYSKYEENDSKKAVSVAENYWRDSESPGHITEKILGAYHNDKQTMTRR